MSGNKTFNSNIKNIYINITNNKDDFIYKFEESKPLSLIENIASSLNLFSKPEYTNIVKLEDIKFCTRAKKLLCLNREYNTSDMIERIRLLINCGILNYDSFEAGNSQNMFAEIPEEYELFERRIMGFIKERITNKEILNMINKLIRNNTKYMIDQLDSRNVLNNSSVNVIVEISQDIQYIFSSKLIFNKENETKAKSQYCCTDAVLG